MSNPLDRVIALIKKTGDNCIILDAAGNPVYVILDFARYENLAGTVSPVTGGSAIAVAGLTEDQLMTKINQDVATWKASTEAADSGRLDELENVMKEVKNHSKLESKIEEKSLNKAKINQDSGQPEEKYYFEPID